jgi:hypothetical protein
MGTAPTVRPVATNKNKDSEFEDPVTESMTKRSKGGSKTTVNSHKTTTATQGSVGSNLTESVVQAPPAKDIFLAKMAKTKEQLDRESEAGVVQ